METKQFKAESKRLLDLMINSIYTNKEIFLRELISNGSDAIDKLHYRSLTDSSIDASNLAINIEIDKKNRNLIIVDNGCGMTENELENNLGTIAKSGTLNFKQENEDSNVDLIGQFGVGFYSAFMVADKITVESKSLDEEKAHRWVSKGADGYTIEECEKDSVGTKIILHIKSDSDEEKYSDFLEEYKIEGLVKKYSDYIKYPIKMEVEHEHKKPGTENEYEKVREIETLNSMIPIWKKKKSEVTEDDYDLFYTGKFNDFEKPLKVIHTSVEGQLSYNALLYIPSHTPYDYYTKEFEKGLELYSNGVLIMEKCGDLLPDYFSFVKGLVDSQDLSLNISREMLQQDRQLKAMAKNIENKIKSELEKMLADKREDYEKFFKAFGTQLKYGTYIDFGMNKDKLKDLIMFYSSTEKKLVTLKEYCSRMKGGQKDIYYACGENVEKIDKLPQVEAVKSKEFEVLYLTENVDEFTLQTLMEYDKNKFTNVCTDKLDIDTAEEKEELKKENDEFVGMFDFMKESISNAVQCVRFTNKLVNHPVCLISEGPISLEMEKTLNAQMGNESKLKAQTVLEINKNHPIVEKLKSLYKDDKEELKNYTKILYSQARLIEGLSIEDPTEISNLICELISK